MNQYHLNIVIALAAYALSSIFSLLGFTDFKAANIFKRVCYGLFTFATFLMTLVTIQSYGQTAYLVTSSLSLTTAISWITLLIHVFFNISAGITLASPIATLIMLIEMFKQKGSHFDTEPPPLLLNLHISSAIIGEAFAIVSFIWAILYLYQQQAMKKKRLNFLIKNSLNLATTEKALKICLWTGFIFLTAGLILGATVNQFGGQSINSVTSVKIFWAIGVWICYLAALIVHYLQGSQTKRTAQITVVGFMLMSLGLFGLTSWR